MSKTVAERTPPTQRQSVQENSYVAHVHARPASEGITGVLVSDTDYPVRVAYSLLNKLLDEFLLKVPKANYERQVNALTTGAGTQPAKGEGVVAQGQFPQIAEYVERYQDPRQADAIMRVQQELDETKIVLVSGRAMTRKRMYASRCPAHHDPSSRSLARSQHKTIESVLARGEQLDSLVERSNTLQQSSKMFYKVSGRASKDAAYKEASRRLGR